MSEVMFILENSDELKRDFLSANGFEVNEHDLIVDAATKETVVDEFGTETSLSEFAGIWPGSKKIVRNDPLSMFSARQCRISSVKFS